MVDVTLPTTNKLADWCAHAFNIGRFPHVIITNERTLLSVVLTLRDSATLWPRFVVSLQSLLKAIGLSDRIVQEELQEYRQVQLTRKTNRRTLGSINDFIYQVRARSQIDGNLSLEKIARELSEVPCSPLKYALPREFVWQLLSAGAREP